MNWVIELTNGAKETIQCDATGVAPDGSLICFAQGQGQNALVIRGYASGQWTKFYQSTLRSVA